MTLRIWGRHTSTNVQKLLWGCAEMGVDFERPDMAGEFGFTDAYLAMNPNRVVPTIDDSGFILWESNACLRYLAEKHGRGGLWPEDPRVRADADRWMDWQTATFWPALRPVFQQLIRTSPEEQNKALIEKGIADAGEISAVLDAALADRDFVAGDAFTMGDIPIGGVIYRWYEMNIARPERPNLRSWYERLQERPAFAEYIMIPLQ
ncbi:MAG: glutathione S-transferase [Rhodospirillaceae bacterium]|mgnify:CR=1 FL=1|nr:glutathione S-transferase [Rhodospirillaceae bacterium]